MKTRDMLHVISENTYASVKEAIVIVIQDYTELGIYCTWIPEPTTYATVGSPSFTSQPKP